MKTIFLGMLNQAINRYLHLDPESEQRLKGLAGKTIRIELLPLHFIFQCAFDTQGVRVHTDTSDAVCDATITGTPLQMLGAMLNKEQRQRFFADDLKIDGNAELAQQVVNLFDELEVDWEEYLAKLVGDVPAYHAGRVLSNVRNWLRDAGNQFAADVSEYLQEEKQWLPAATALQDFFNDIDVLRMDVDRAEARIQHIYTQLTNEEPS